MKFIKILTFLSLCLISLTGISQTHIVQNLNNSGSGSFRETISIANENDTIRFNPSLIELGSDTLVLDSVITIDKNLVIKGLYNSEDTLSITVINDNPFFNISSVENIVLDSLILCDSPENSIAFWITMSFSNFTLENSKFIGFRNVALDIGNTSYSIKNCVFEPNSNSNSHQSILVFSNEEDHTYEIASTRFKGNGESNGLSFVFAGSPENHELVIKDSYFENIQSVITGQATVNVFNCTFFDSPIQLWLANNGLNEGDQDIILNVRSSTLLMEEKPHGIICKGTNVPNTTSFYSLNLKNTTFNGGVYDSTLNNGPFYPVVFQNYFGPALDELEIQGCIFNNITGFNELPIDISGGYNLFGFPQTIGLHPTDLQNVSSADIDLGPLQNNGGFTPTHLPSLESIAFNAGNPDDTTDAQNGPIIQRRDIGAAEIQALKFTDTVEHCGTEFEWRDSLYTTTDRFFEIQTSVTASLDTVFELDLTLSNLQAQAINDWGLLTANEADATYQWIDCHTNLPILGETNQVFEPNIAGNYQVIIDNGICVDTSACMLINNIGLEEETEPTIHAFISESTLYLFGNQILNSPFRIYNTLGQSIVKGSTQHKQINLSGFTTGVYFIEFITEKNIEPVKFVIE